jgi:lipopolysaccharide biosynthesis glycosyltransferase
VEVSVFNLNNQAIEILLTFDDNYAQHAATLCNSMFENNPNISFNFHIIYKNLNQTNRETLAGWLSEKGHTLNFYPLADEDTVKFFLVRDGDHVSIDTYFRLMGDVILPDDLSKVLYIDPDTVNTASLTDLWNTDISDYALGAVASTVPEERKLKLGLDLEDSYFQAGVLLINLDYWRKNEVGPRLRSYLRENYDKMDRWDQDILNAVLRGEWLKIPLRYNAYETVFHKKDFFKSNWAPEYTSVGKKAALDSPAIIHYTNTGVYKPWFKNSISANKDKYVHYRKGTPYASIPLKNLPFTVVLAGPYMSGKGVLGCLLDGHPNVFSLPPWHDKLVDTFQKVLQGLPGQTYSWWKESDERVWLVRRLLTAQDYPTLEAYALYKKMVFAVASNHYVYIDCDLDFYGHNQQFFSDLVKMPAGALSISSLVALFYRSLMENWPGYPGKYEDVESFITAADPGYSGFDDLFVRERTPKVIYIKRNPLDSILAVCRRSYLNKLNEVYKDPNYIFKRDHRILRTIFVDKNVHDWQRKYPDRFKIIDFNDLICSHEKVIAEVADFLGLEFQDCLLTPTILGRPIETPVGVQLLGKIIDTQDSVELDEKYKNKVIELYAKYYAEAKNINPAKASVMPAPSSPVSSGRKNDEVDELRQALEKERRRNEKLKNSWSWRLTAPLRAFRRIKKGK